MRRIGLIAFSMAALLAACGDDDIGTDPGGGTGTLLVHARAEYRNDGFADLRVDVARAGAAVADAAVVVESDLGRVTLVHEGGGTYRGAQAGWASGYALAVSAGDDHLDGSIVAPAPARLTSPDPAVPFDPQADADGLILLQWAGDRAHRVRVKTKGFEWSGVDQGRLMVPAMVFVETSQDIEIKRENSVALAGGAPGSDLSAKVDAKVTVLVSNPFPE